MIDMTVLTKHFNSKYNFD